MPTLERACSRNGSPCRARGKKAFFLYLFPKNSRDNIEDDQLKALKRLTKYYFAMKSGEINTALECGELNEVNCNEKET